MACGTPVVGFAVGGIKETVRPGITGELVAPNDTQELSVTMQRLLDSKDHREKMAAQCREVVLQNYSLAIQAKRFSELYTEILSTVN